jgi:DNA invertase Pin-like site-specific DNA recombinase
VGRPRQEPERESRGVIEKLDGQPKRAALWLRVSTPDQKLDSQDTPLASYCQARGWQISARFEEIGVSGAAAYRAVVEDILASARRREYDVLVVFRGDRTFRSAGRGVTFIDELLALGVHFAAVNDGIDTSTPMGATMAKLVIVLAEWERAGLRARVTAGIAAYRAKHGRWGRRRAENVPDAAEVQRLRDQGVTWRAISEQLACTTSAAYRALRGA